MLLDELLKFKFLSLKNLLSEKNEKKNIMIYFNLLLK